MAAGEYVSDEEWTAAEETCDVCFWSSDEYVELTTYGPLFKFAFDWLRRRDLKLEAEDLTSREEEVVLLVHGEIEAARNRRLKTRTETRTENKHAIKFGQGRNDGDVPR